MCIIVSVRIDPVSISRFRLLTCLINAWEQEGDGGGGGVVHSAAPTMV